MLPFIVKHPVCVCFFNVFVLFGAVREKLVTRREAFNLEKMSPQAAIMNKFIIKSSKKMEALKVKFTWKLKLSHYLHHETFPELQCRNQHVVSAMKLIVPSVSLHCLD